MAQVWFIDSGGRLDGPLTAKQLQARAGSGELRPADRVSHDRVKWVRAEKVKGLRFAPAPSTTQVGPDATPRPAESLVQTVASAIDQVPGYEILGALGAGACGVVYRARQLKLDRVVALKAVVVPRTNPQLAVARFEQEAVALARLRHPNIVAVHDSGHHDGRVYFAMELLDGEDLSRRIEAAGRLDERTAWWVARQTAAGLAHAAEHGVFHRDVKPANLFLVPPPTGVLLPPGVPMVKVTDFGLALTRRDDAAAADVRLTSAGMVLGTPVYMAPEQFSTSDIDHRADIYSLGTTVYHALTGRVPFDGKTVWDVMVKKTEPFTPPDPPASAESVALLAAMMDPEPAARVGSYADLIARIDALPCMRTESGVAAVPRRTTARRPKWRVYAVAVVAGLVLAGAAVIAAKLTRADPDPAAGAPVARPVTFVSAGPAAALFDGKSVAGWSGPGWVIEPDDEKLPVLAGAGNVRRGLPQPVPPAFRVVLGLDLHRAAAAEVVVAAGDGPPESAPRWSLRVTRDGAVLGRRDGHRGEFRPLAAPVPFPTAAELEGRTPYQEVRYERTPGRIAVWFRTRPAGTIDAGDSLKAGELRLLIDGGPVRIESASVEELRESN